VQATDRDWLNWALAPVSGNSPLVSMELAETVKGVASKVRLAVRFENDPERVHHFCLKAFLDMPEGSESAGKTALREADFYQKIAPQLAVRVPACPVVISDHERFKCIMVMEDIIANGGRFCDALQPFTVEQVRASLEQVARLHAASHLLADNPWIDTGTDWMKRVEMFPQDWLQGQLRDGRGGDLPGYVLDAESLIGAVAAMTAHSGVGRQTLLHGDCHIANFYMTAAGPGLADWQLIRRGSWAIDVAYHINSVLPPQIAEREERSLVQHYLEAVGRHGGQPPDSDTAWEDYCRALPYGFYLWAITQFVERSRIHRNFQGLGAAIVRNNSYDRLGLRGKA